MVSQASEESAPLSSGQLEAALLALIHSNNAGEHFKNIDLVSYGIGLLCIAGVDVFILYL